MRRRLIAAAEVGLSVVVAPGDDDGTTITDRPGLLGEIDRTADVRSGRITGCTTRRARGAPRVGRSGTIGSSSRARGPFTATACCTIRGTPPSPTQ
jgi:hypothetical protein